MQYSLVALIAGTLTLQLAAQNALQHYDGTDEFTSRGGVGTAAKTLLQRIPMDQVCGRTGLSSLTCIIQDQSAATPESFTIEVRATDPAGPPTGAPDMSPAGLLASVGPVPITFPGSGVSAVVVTTALTIPLAPFAPGVPAGDVYIGLALPASPLWTTDGISIHISAALSGAAGEQMRAGAVGYTGAVGLSGLGWDSPAGGPPVLGSGNRSWNVRAGFVDDTLQPFASNAAVFTGAGGTGLDPNFGYAGIFPDTLARGDTVGWRALATGSVGDLAFLVLGPPLPAGPIVFAPFGLLCLVPSGPLTNVGLAFYGAAPPGEPATTVAATWGPFAVPFTGFDAYAQALSFKLPAGIGVLTTSCRTNF